MAGDWSVTRGGRPLCSLTLSNTAAGEEFVARTSPSPARNSWSKFAGEKAHETAIAFTRASGFSPCCLA